MVGIQLALHGTSIIYSYSTAKDNLLDVQQLPGEPRYDATIKPSPQMEIQLRLRDAISLGGPPSCSFPLRIHRPRQSTLVCMSVHSERPFPSRFPHHSGVWQLLIPSQLSNEAVSERYVQGKEGWYEEEEGSYNSRDLKDCSDEKLRPWVRSRIARLRGPLALTLATTYGNENMKALWKVGEDWRELQSTTTGLERGQLQSQ